MLLVGIANCIVKCKESTIVRLPKIQRVPIQPVVTGFGLGEGIDRMDWYEAYTPSTRWVRANLPNLGGESDAVCGIAGLLHVNGNVLIPLLEERTPLATNPATR